MGEMRNLPKLCIVIPCYNEEEVLPITAPLFLKKILSLINLEKISTNSKILFIVNNPVPVSLLSGDRKPQIRFLGNHHSGSGNLYHKSFRM